MSASPAAEPPPYSATPVPTVSSLSTAAPHAGTAPTQRKTVRFQTSNQEYLQRGKQPGAASGPAPAARDWASLPAATAAPVPPSLDSSGPGSIANSFIHPIRQLHQLHPLQSSPVHSTQQHRPHYTTAPLATGLPRRASVDTDRVVADDVEDGSGDDGSEASDADAADGTDDDGDKVARPTLLQPRVAVVLGLPSLWHLPLFACRSLSVCPAIWWSLGIFIRLLTQLHALAIAQGGVLGSEAAEASHGGHGGGAGGGLFIHERTGLSLESRLKLTETALAMIWCGASAYLSFFFTDCLMSRWLLNYTPQATIVRLLAINALNGYLTSWVIYLMGSGGDSRLLLPAWVAIAAILTALYHVTQRKINIRKETSISISVFSGASFISMVSLLAQLYWDRPEYVDVPVVALARRVCTEAARLAGNLFDIGNITMDL